MLKFNWFKNAWSDKLNQELLYTALKYIFAAYIMGVANELADVRGSLVSERVPPLPDVGFDIVPYFPSVLWIPDLLNKLALLLVIVRVLCSQRRRKLACVFMEIHITLMLLRCVCLPLTTFPASNPKCYNRLDARPHSIFIQPAFRILQPNGLSSCCHDLLFSGHAVVSVISALFIHDAGGAVWWRVAAWIGCVFGCLIIVATRIHYTADIVVAIIISYLVYLQWRGEVVHLFQPSRVLEV